MANDKNVPRRFPGVMVSSTFTDLAEHRAALMKALHGQDLHAVAMENDAAKLIDVIESSLEMVRKSEAYIGIITHKYGQTPEDARNPELLSVTELEFNLARELELPILLFIMGENHPGTRADFETNPGKIEKLNAFRERAKLMKAGSKVHRVYATFNSFEEFSTKAIQSVAELRRLFDAKGEYSAAAPPAPAAGDPLPKPPALYAEPPYIGSHQFTGRQAQLDALNDWAVPADTHPIIFFDAIGGTGKSMLTWHWLNQHAGKIRADWAGRLWYSFYERGAIMADFCRHALAYITGEPIDSFKKQKSAELSKLLLHHLQMKPWLLVLDGIERILVAYNRYDAAHITDEQASKPTDEISNRDPCSAIRPEDDDLLRLLAGASPSKLVITSRLVPLALLNRAGQAIPGVLRLPLPGLRPVDAEALFRSCGISGNSEAMQSYLKTNCDCHPLVIGALAGLINNYLPDRGNFDDWQAHSGELNLSDLDLVQSRNHILKTAIEGVGKDGRQILSLLSLLSENVAYETLRALTEKSLRSKDLMEAISDLESRGLLQYDAQTRRYDLHPVVRAIVSEGLLPDERNQVGQQVVDHFASRPHGPYEQAQTLEDVSDGLHIVRTLLKMGKFEEATNAYRSGLSGALLINLEAHSELLSLLKPFFPDGWSRLPESTKGPYAGYLAGEAASALYYLGDSKSSLEANGAALESHLRAERWQWATTVLRNISNNLAARNLLAEEAAVTEIGAELAAVSGDQESIFQSLLSVFVSLAKMGQWERAQEVWNQLDPMGRNWSRVVYRPGYAEFWHALFHYWHGDLLEKHLTNAEQLLRSGGDRVTLRELQALRGEWQLGRGEWQAAAECLADAVSMARAVGQNAAPAETRLALARFHLGQLADARYEAERLTNASRVSYLDIAELWLAVGDTEQAKTYALAAYERAWADGEPYVWRHSLSKSRELLEKLGVEIPDLPRYDAAKRERFPWEDTVRGAIEKLRMGSELEGRAGAA